MFVKSWLSTALTPFVGAEGEELNGSIVWQV